MIYKFGTVTKQSWDYDLQPWDCNKFPHWYFIPNIGLHTLTYNPVSRSWDYDLQAWDWKKNSHIGILFEIQDYVRLCFTILVL